jgi:type II secretory pathway component HofQ
MRASLQGLVRASLGLAVLIVAASHLPAAPTQDEPARGSTSEQARRALDQPHSVDFQGMTLTAALDALREQSKVNLVLDRTTIQGLEIGPDEVPAITLKLNQVKLRTILKTLLAPYKLTYVVDKEVVLITTEQEAIERQMAQRVDVDFADVPLEKAIKQLAKETGVNLVLDPRQASKVKETISLKLEDVPLEVTVRLLAEMVGLRSVRQANVLFVTTPDSAAALRKEEEAANAAAQKKLDIVEKLLQDLRGGGR